MMALSDCERCWETPCVCGYNYGEWPPEKIIKQIQMLNSVLSSKLDRDLDAEKLQSIASLLRGDSRAVVVFDFQDAPGLIQEMSPHGGDEEEVLIISGDAFYSQLNDVSGVSWFEWFSERLSRYGEEEWMDANIAGLDVKVMIFAH